MINLIGNVILYADDGAILYSSNSYQELQENMQRDMDELFNWFNINQLNLNISKTKYMILKNRKPETDDFTIKYNDEPIEKVEKFVYLGLHINSAFKWNDHIFNIKNKIIPYIFILRKTKNFLPKHVLLQLYNSYILSQLVYLNPIWSGCAQYLIKELFILQKRAIKYILHLPIRYPTAALFNSNSKFSSLPHIIFRELAILTCKIVNGKILHNFELRRIGERHQYQTRRRSHYQVETFTTNANKNNILYRGLMIFNELPRLIKYETNFLKYKREINRFYKENNDV